MALGAVNWYSAQLGHPIMRLFHREMPREAPGVRVLFQCSCTLRLNKEHPWLNAPVAPVQEENPVHPFCLALSRARLIFLLLPMVTGSSPPWAAPGGGSCGKGRDTSCAGSAAGPAAGGELQGAWQGAPCLGRWIRCAMRQTEHYCLYPAAEHFGGPVISPSLIIEQRVCRAGARTAFLK